MLNESHQYTKELDFAQNYVYIPPPALGDINGDGTIDILDLVRLIQLVIYDENYTADEIAQGDINEDGATNILDAVTIVNLILAGGNNESPT